MANVDKLMGLGFEFETSLEDGLKETYQWYKEYHPYNGRYDAFLTPDYTNKI